jgi:hypothetical protein
MSSGAVRANAGGAFFVFEKVEHVMKRLNWKDDPGGTSTEAWASRAVGGKYRVSRREGVDGVWWLEVEHLVHSGGGGRYADWFATPVRHQAVIHSWREATNIAEADNDERRAIKERGAA